MFAQRALAGHVHLERVGAEDVVEVFASLLLGHHVRVHTVHDVRGALQLLCRLILVFHLHLVGPTTEHRADWDHCWDTEIRWT